MKGHAGSISGGAWRGQLLIALSPHNAFDVYTSFLIWLVNRSLKIWNKKMFFHELKNYSLFFFYTVWLYWPLVELLKSWKLFCSMRFFRLSLYRISESNSLPCNRSSTVLNSILYHLVKVFFRGDQQKGWVFALRAHTRVHLFPENQFTRIQNDN